MESFPAGQTRTEGGAWSVIQDREGIFYCGFNSLATFDGARWRTFPIANSYTVRGLAFGSDGRIWAGAVNEIGFFSENGGNWVFQSLRDKLPPGDEVIGEVWHAYAFGTGAVFVAEGKILHWDGSEFHISRFLSTRHLRGFQLPGRILVQHLPSGVYVVGATGPQLIIPASVIGETPIFWLEEQAGKWTYFSSAGLFELQNGVVHPIVGAASTFIRGHLPSSAVALPDGRIALGTMDAGLAFIRRDGGVDSVLNDAADVGATVAPLAVDRNDALWVRSGATLVRLNLAKETTLFDHRAQLPTSPTEVIIPAPGGGIIAGQNTGLLWLPPGANRFSHYGPGQSTVFDALKVPDGVLTVGYRSVSYVQPERVTVLHETKYDVFAIGAAWSDAETFFIADGRRVVELTRAGRSRIILEELPEAVTSVTEDGDHTLWLGTKGQGLLRVPPLASGATNGRVALNDHQHLGIPLAAGESRVARMPDKSILAFNALGGWLLRVGARRFEPIRGCPTGRPPVIAAGIAGDQTIWLVHPAGRASPPTVACVTITAHGADWAPHAVDGLSAIGAPQAILAEAGTSGKRVLWIGGSVSLLRHEFAGAAIAPLPAPPLLRSSWRDRAGQREPLRASIPFTTSLIEFEFAAPEAARYHPLHFESRIEGIDSDWIAAGPDSRRELTALRDGNYIFRVRTVADTGKTSVPQVLRFEVLPPWWRTKGALAGALAALLPLGYGVYRLRIRSLRRRNAELEAKVQLRTQQLEQANAAKTQFVANMSHDIRNPLNGIVGLALALEDTPLEPRQQEIAATLRQCTTYLSSLVDDVLDFATIEAGRVELRNGSYAPRELLASIVETLETDAAASGAALVIETDVSLPPNLMGDAGRIQQILVNFVSNALKYAGGQVQLSASRPDDSPDEIEFAVCDQGAGLTAAEVATLFTKFSRLRRTRDGAEIPGTGLGLASCRLLADLMGGSVGVRSRPGNGSRFFLRLPLEVAPAPNHAAPIALPNTTVLVVEDADYNAWAAAAVLAKLGLNSERASTGAEALERFAAKRYNVVLLDRNLPDMDGTEVARQMRATESNDGLRSVILAVTAYCTEQDRTLCLEAGMDAFVGKPLTPDKLRRALVAAAQPMLTAVPVDAPQPAGDEVDLTMLKYLSAGTEEDLNAQIDRFVAALREVEGQLQEHTATGDRAAAAAAAHQIRGQAIMVGFAALTAAATRFEALARATEGGELTTVLPAVERESERLRGAMRHRRRAVPAA
jgi:signal transduction histidine kinase/CheY-like chemotaxis protein/HPt (histidine-containing phosphotransfer) domain-containing protein